MSGKRQIKRPVSENDIRLWERDWATMMITIWREQIMKLGIVDTMQLYRNITHSISGSEQITIAHEFMKYGIYQAAGVGNGYYKNNNGNLDIMDPSMRKARHLDKPRTRGPKWSTKHITSGKPRKKRDWFSKKYLRSIYVLGEVERDLYGNAYMGTLSNVVSDLFASVKDENNKLRNM
ncbi:MAG: hypothetical protein LKE54_03720 [Prevotella sp.]|jgi:hypothetical protein|nr:hypothetical protein [Prevotella sp.]MCH3994155.1 hypothetical protein [Prevotella sp.]